FWSLGRWSENVKLLLVVAGRGRRALYPGSVGGRDLTVGEVDVEVKKTASSGKFRPLSPHPAPRSLRVRNTRAVLLPGTPLYVTRE
ncbi:hypothetical protein JYU34_002967, partial [Plutella xylostella]